MSQMSYLYGAQGKKKDLRSSHAFYFIKSLLQFLKDTHIYNIMMVPLEHITKNK